MKVYFAVALLACVLQTVVLTAQPLDDDISAPEEVAFQVAEDALAKVEVAANGMMDAEDVALDRYCAYCNSKPLAERRKCRSRCKICKAYHYRKAFLTSWGGIKAIILKSSGCNWCKYLPRFRRKKCRRGCKMCEL